MAQITARRRIDAEPVDRDGRVDGIDQRDHQQFEDAADGDANLNARVGPQRVHRMLGEIARQQQAADAQAAHEGGEQHAQRNGGRADHQLQQLIPDDFVNQRRASAAGE